jgi:polyisoprenoid-binding protein YceI
MKRLLSSIFVLALFLSACAPAAVVTDTNPTTAGPTQAPAATITNLPTVATIQQSPAATTMSSTATPAGSAIPVTSGITVFKIVPGESKVTYEVTETFLNQNNKISVAVGVTDTISGEIKADKSNPAATTLGLITVDVSKFASDSRQRDSMIQRNFLQSSTYPTATFVSKSITGLPATYTEGTDYSFEMSGDLTVKTTTQPVTFLVSARLTGDTLSGSASTRVLMSQFGVGPISLLGILQTQDEVKITFDFVARP